MGNWTPEGFVGKMFRTTAKHAPPPPMMEPPALWGVDEVVRERFKSGIARIETRRWIHHMAFPFSPAEVVEHFRVYFGPAQRAFASLDDAGQAALREDLEELWVAHNLATDGTTHVESEYLEVHALKESGN